MIVQCRHGRRIYTRMGNKVDLRLAIGSELRLSEWFLQSSQMHLEVTQDPYEEMQSDEGFRPIPQT